MFSSLIKETGRLYGIHSIYLQVSVNEAINLFASLSKIVEGTATRIYLAPANIASMVR
jgi:hypothetical protein